MLTACPEIVRTASLNTLFYDLQVLGAARVGKRYRADEEIYGEGEAAEHVFLVVSGVVRIFSVLEDGRRQIHAFHFAGDVFGIENGPFYSQSAEAICGADVEIRRRATLDAASMGDCWTARELWLLTSVALRRARDHLVVLGRKTARERVSGFLVDMHRQMGTEIFDLPMSRVDIADYLGLTLETVSRTFSDLQRRGLIDVSACRHLRLCDVPALHRIAGGGGTGVRPPAGGGADIEQIAV